MQREVAVKVLWKQTWLHLSKSKSHGHLVNLRYLILCILCLPFALMPCVMPIMASLKPRSGSKMLYPIERPLFKVQWKLRFGIILQPPHLLKLVCQKCVLLSKSSLHF